MAKILVTGGAGYIGSHTVRLLTQAGHDVFVYDDLSNGHKEALDPDIQLVIGSINDDRHLGEAFSDVRPDAVIHFAGAIEPSLSAKDPKRFYRTNVGGTLALADQLAAHDVPVVFSSSCAIYGTPPILPVNEKCEPRPESLYGETKLIGERILKSYDVAYGVRSIALRYFNAAGADPSGLNGADHCTPVHIFTLACQAALGLVPRLAVHGEDYETPDGTCQRDYVHVMDLAVAHLLALDALLAGCESAVYNVGTGTPYSVREVVAAVERASDRVIPLDISPRRSGDPAAVWADSSRIQLALGWSPAYSSIQNIAESAWRWHRSHPHGFAASKSLDSG